MLRPLFIIGNKRSGTSQLVRVLNLHPGIFVSHESDIAWILQQFHRLENFHAHPWDSDRGMRLTLETAGHLLQRNSTPWDNFSRVQTAIMEKGTPWLPARHKPGLKWLGDKKPMQHTDPELLQFLRLNFPAARYLHIVRHPFEVVDSSDRFNLTRDGDFWQGLSPVEKLERWTFHEQQVLQLRQNVPDSVHSLRFEDFCRDTEKELSAVFRFLDLEPDHRIMREAARQTHPLLRPLLPLHGSEETTRIAALYGYDLAHLPSRLQRVAQNLYWRAKKVSH